MWDDARWAYLHYILGRRWESIRTCSCLGIPVTDEFRHQFMALVSPTDMDGAPNPYFDDVTDDDIPDGVRRSARGMSVGRTRRRTSAWLLAAS